MRYVCLLLLMVNTPLFAEPLLLTGQISSAKKQTVTSPRGNRWQIQIQWLIEEGELAKQGDIIAVFDGSTIQTQLDVNEERLEALALELTQTKMELAQAVTEAKGRYEVARMRVAQAKIEASVPDGEVSDFDKGQYELAWQKALLDEAKAKETLNLRIQEEKTGVQKKQIDILKVEEDIAYQKRQLKTMNVVAEIDGPVTHALHPWTEKKITAGINVSAGLTILEVQATANFQIESWVHETDADNIQIGDTVELVLDAYPTVRHTGRVAAKSSQSEKRGQWSDSVYFPLTLTFDQRPTQALLPGMSVRIVHKGDDV